MQKEPVIARVLEEQVIVRTACRAILSRLVLICLTMNQLPVCQTMSQLLLLQIPSHLHRLLVLPNHLRRLLVHCIVEAALKMRHQTVWFPVLVVHQRSAPQAKVVMGILHVKIMTLSFAVHRGMKLHRLAQSRVLRVATMNVKTARYALGTLLAINPTLISLSSHFIAAQLLKRLL